MIKSILFSNILPYFFLLYLLGFTTEVFSQGDDCNKLGVWLWFIEQTEFESHEELADTLSSMGVKRIYVKVADGSVDTVRWHEIVDKNLVNAYKNRGLEVWAWSYNYPGNNMAQAEALKIAAKTGYQGFVVDVESQFDGQTAILSNLFFSFYNTRADAQAEGIIQDSFPLGVTTWGNPEDHNFSIGLMDPYVDLYLPQTYVENWGNSFITNLSFWIEEGNEEYKRLGATKPIHHIVSTEQGIINSEELNEFISAAGPETSVWRIPGGGTPLSIWDDWKGVNWNVDFCEITSTKEAKSYPWLISPNPSQNFVHVNTSESNFKIEIYCITGQLKVSCEDCKKIDISNLSSGQYFIKIIGSENWDTKKIIKI